MKTKTWIIYPNFSQPIWDSEEEQINWIDGDGECLDLPVEISTEEEAEEFLKQSAIKELGTEYFQWIIREY